MSTVYAVFSNEFFYGGPGLYQTGEDTVTVDGQVIDYDAQGYYIPTSNTSPAPPLDYQYDTGLSGYLVRFDGGFSGGVYLYDRTVFEGVYAKPPNEVAGAIHPPDYTETLWYPEQIYVPITVSLSASPSLAYGSLTLTKDASGAVTSVPLTGSIAFTDNDPTTTPSATLDQQTATATDATGNPVTLTTAQMSALEAAFENSHPPRGIPITAASIGRTTQMARR